MLLYLFCLTILGTLYWSSLPPKLRGGEHLIATLHRRASRLESWSFTRTSSVYLTTERIILKHVMGLHASRLNSRNDFPLGCIVAANVQQPLGHDWRSTFNVRLDLSLIRGPISLFLFLPRPEEFIAAIHHQRAMLGLPALVPMMTQPRTPPPVMRASPSVSIPTADQWE